ncbi:hypothetical protein MKEN_01326500 [Mycena kentingensis (nom. inval.)]|nr:hypothetical protein MKEN_01326500 [Mycena kentingensis (nom. inval.)]
MSSSRSFWDDYPNFQHQPSAPIRSEFNRLADEMGWRKKTRKEQWGRCGQVEFERYFGANEPDLAAWQAMLAFCGVEQKVVPDSVTKCKAMLNGQIFVNIYDLLDAKRTGEPVKRHHSRNALRVYILQSKARVFPKARAKKNAFLKVLLIGVF